MIKFLSYTLNENTHSYGNRNKFEIVKKSSILNGDVANDSFIKTTVHIGTHLDMPYHFYENGQTISDFNDDFWLFKSVKIIELEPKNLVIEYELIDKISHCNCEMLIVKTGACDFRDQDRYWSANFGFAPTVYDILISKMPNLRVFGFDSISISSFRHRDIGRLAHIKFLNPNRPILLLEDMNLKDIDENTKLNQILIAPMMIEKCDGLPCSVVGFLDD